MFTMKITNPHADKILFAGTLLVCLYWLTGLRVNVYEYAFAGAIFELLFFPMILFFIALPVLAVVQLTRQRFSFRSFCWYALLLQLITLLIWTSFY